ncbi:MAG TPA: malto-oligosyltrehalose synthase, partial [Geminicoccaceae bacterium]|nr:malto-oligosyltrehalose synthase [Geminicoccaceae bacterium]
YDVVDPNRLDPELGGEADFLALCETLKAHGLGLLLDIVPNHMGIGPDNPWWWDVLKRGRESRYARFFDVDFARDPDGKLVLPVLGGPFEEMLGRGELKLDQDHATGEPVLTYYDERFPLARGASSGGVDDFERLIAAQPYRLVFWREGTERRNYRRFFNIDQLAGLRVEEPDVFEASHRLILDLARRDLIQGLRVDHVDGLTDPKAYLERLRHRLAEVRPDAAPFYVVVEKILVGEEQLPEDWPVAGTTGYEFMNEALNLLVDRRGLEPLATLAAELSGEAAGYPELVRAAKRQVLEQLFAGELGVLGERAAKLCSLDRDAARAALRELLLAFPVYRTYGGTSWRAADAGVLERSFAEAGDRADAGTKAALACLERLLGSPLDNESRTFLWGLQQLSGPLMAKSVEDTAFYRYPRLLALNEVGGEPDARGLEPEEFHRLAAHRLERWPGSLLATATHDTKRGEDARARLAVLSELPDAWAAEVRAWRDLNARHRRGSPAIHPKDEYTLYQTLVGVWPAGLDPTNAGGVAALRERLEGWLTKALREGKERSDWNAPDHAYEEAAQGFLREILAPSSGEFVGALAAFALRIAPAGVANGLAQLLLKLTAPGVPDIYQGTELWDLSLVDPDNRRPVDFAARERLLGSETPLEELLRDWPSGGIKHRVLARGLALRAHCPDIFAQGQYQPLAVEGPCNRNTVAFARILGKRIAVTVAGRQLGRWLDGAPLPLVPPEAWGDTAVVLPQPWAGLRLTDQLTAAAAEPQDGGRLPLAVLLSRCPVALLSGG